MQLIFKRKDENLTIEIKDGVSTMMQITDCEPEELSIGMPVKVEFRRVQSQGKAGVLLYGYKAVPAA